MIRATAEQKRRFTKATELGCLPCLLDGHSGTPAGISHCHDHGYRDHDRFWPSCEIHHLYQHAVAGIPNRHKNPIEFAKSYGTDHELHLMTIRMLEDKTIE
jgi:hypothetical protein